MTDDEILKAAERIQRKRNLGYQLREAKASIGKAFLHVTNDHGYDEEFELDREGLTALQEVLGYTVE